MCTIEGAVLDFVLRSSNLDFGIVRVIVWVQEPKALVAINTALNACRQVFVSRRYEDTRECLFVSRTRKV